MYGLGVGGGGGGILFFFILSLCVLFCLVFYLFSFLLFFFFFCFDNLFHYIVVNPNTIQSRPRRLTHFKIHIPYLNTNTNN